jgi:signal transduction histidine kinase
MSDESSGPAEPEESDYGREQMLADVLSCLPGTAITVFDRRLRVLLLSGGAPKDLGLDPDKVIGRPIAEILPSADFTRLESLYRSALAGESP